jgi:hypothetical protein
MEKITTVDKNYLVSEDRSAFDTVKIGMLEIFKARPEGFKYNNCSNKFIVVAAPVNGKYAVGDSVWGEHRIVDTPVEVDGQALFAAKEESLWLKAEDPSEHNDEHIISFEYLKEDEYMSNGIVAGVATTRWEKGVVLSGPLPKGTVITYWTDREYEVWYNERQILLLSLHHVTSIDGEVCGDWCELDDMNEKEFECGFLYLRGKLGLMKKLGYDFCNSRIAMCKSADPEFDGKMVLTLKRGKYVHKNLIEAIVPIEESQLLD